MSRKRTRNILIGAVVLLAAALSVFGWRRADVRASHIVLMSQLAKEGRLQYPDLVFFDGTNEDKDRFLTEKQIFELFLDAMKKEYKKKGGKGDLPDGTEAFLHEIAIKSHNEAIKQVGRPLRVSEIEFKVSAEYQKPAKKYIMAYYDGPQTVEALMAEFDENFSRVMTPQGSEIDKIFPREEWIQRALDLGVEFLDNYDYSGILQIRSYLARIRRHPEKYVDLIQEHGLEDDANYNAFIDKEIMDAAQDNILWRNAIRKDP